MQQVKSLRDQIYKHLQELIQSGELPPGSLVKTGTISKQMGISKTPLRDAFIQLELEGFVDILPRKGIIVKPLTEEDLKNLFEIIGALEATALKSSFSNFKTFHISKMNLLNEDMRQAVKDGDFDRYYDLNHDLHQMFIEYSDNPNLQKLIAPIKQRIYDFPRKSNFDEWELDNCEEHQQIIDLIEKGDPKGAAKVLQDVHWSYEIQEGKIQNGSK